MISFQKNVAYECVCVCVCSILNFMWIGPLNYLLASVTVHTLGRNHKGPGIWNMYLGLTIDRA